MACVRRGYVFPAWRHLLPLWMRRRVCVKTVEFKARRRVASYAAVSRVSLTDLTRRITARRLIQAAGASSLPMRKLGASSFSVAVDRLVDRDHVAWTLKMSLVAAGSPGRIGLSVQVVVLRLGLALSLTALLLAVFGHQREDEDKQRLVGRPVLKHIPKRVRASALALVSLHVPRDAMPLHERKSSHIPQWLPIPVADNRQIDARDHAPAW